MADSAAGSESPNESGDDSQLTIRIPNPKVYMARQSQWKGRRGKPRCDHCRLNNLKCDRVLPTCNHCSWAAGRECKYTPLPTPAHRGIPRCDRCRQKNLKCDRNLPVCNHCQEDKETDCNYTPKKRHKVPSDHGLTRDRPVAPYASKTASFLVNEHAGDEESPKNGSPAGPSTGPVYEGEMRTEPQIRQYVPPHPPPPGAIDEDAPMDQDPDGSFQQRGADGSFTWQGMIVTTPHIDPWMHPSFVPLPDSILRGLRAVNAIEMPSRHAFEEAMIKFLGTLSQDLRDTATFPVDVYAQMARAVSENRLSSLSPRLQMWTSCHHARSGSSKRHLILLPRDAFYNMNREDEEKLRLNYVMQADGEENSESAKKLAENGLSPLQSAAVFERVPVQNQIYDVLVYTHRNHGTSANMLFEARRIGVATITWPMVEMFIRLCPLCKLRAKGGPRAPGPVVDEESASFRAGPPPVVKR
ncbi:hypothetical protein PYCCODRAFT_1408448 [Trametes coccinea BRFM310]|uniref:Zn(2)-C6 fungal-type domain-containing protein n=1 Tax=Trametes coccinea (strain BRFM310) TaxID=1353009 RepID=A0A1Y2IUY9_TRAC3|nr:hypothetical protein PYCCODRAFT_1408448 [Trametes coccinea BRFM310]